MIGGGGGGIFLSLVGSLCAIVFQRNGKQSRPLNRCLDLIYLKLRKAQILNSIKLQKRKTIYSL